jgi:hypothetical protein
LLKNILEIYTNNTIRIKISNNTTEERVISQGVKQGCTLSPTLLYNIYEIIKQLNEKYTTGIKISNDTKSITILLADDQAVIANSKDKLQRGLQALHRTVQTFCVKIAHQKTKIMDFKGTEPIRSKIVIDNMILEQVNTFTFHIKKKDTYIPKSQNFYKYWDF